MKRIQDHNDIGRELLGSFTDDFPYLLVLLDPELRIQWASSSSQEVIGHSYDDLRGVGILDILHPDDVEQIAPMVLGMIDSAEDTVTTRAAASMAEVPVRVRSADGIWIPVSASGRVIDESGRLMAVVRPAAERHSLGDVLDRLAGSAELGGILESVVDLLTVQFSLDGAALLHDFDGYVDVEGDETALPENTDDVLERLRRNGPSTAIDFTEDHWMVPVLSRTQESLFGTFVFPSPRSGGPTPWDASILHRTAGLATLAFTKAHDTRLLERAASTDYLTGVLNRRAFESSLAQMALRSDALPVTVFFVDVDRFKPVNDEYGHAVGDETLVEIARRLEESTRAVDLVGRLGGDEFAICATNLSPDHIEAARGRIDAAFVAPIVTAVATFDLTLSIGSATAYTEDDLEHAIDSADADMYRRKVARRTDASI